MVTMTDSSTTPPPTAAPAPHGSMDPGIAEATQYRGRLTVEGLTPVSPKRITVEYLAGIPWVVIGLGLAITAAVFAVLWSAWLWTAVVLLLILIAQWALLLPRRVRACGYREGADDLVVASGVMFRSLETIPFGRIQSVDISEGPIERRYGLATISVTTAASSGGVGISGLPREEAERLRARLSERGIEKMAAL